MKELRWREMIDGSYRDSNPGRSSRRMARIEHIKGSLETYNKDDNLDSLLMSILYKI